jgi:hypothetical protein
VVSRLGRPSPQQMRDSAQAVERDMAEGAGQPARRLVPVPASGSAPSRCATAYASVNGDISAIPTPHITTVQHRNSYDGQSPMTTAESAIDRRAPSRSDSQSCGCQQWQACDGSRRGAPGRPSGESQPAPWRSSRHRKILIRLCPSRDLGVGFRLIRGIVPSYGESFSDLAKA